MKRDAHELIDNERREMKRARLDAASRIVCALLELRGVYEMDELTFEMVSDRALKFVDAIERKL